MRSHPDGNIISQLNSDTKLRQAKFTTLLIRFWVSTNKLYAFELAPRMPRLHNSFEGKAPHISHTSCVRLYLALPHLTSREETASSVRAIDKQINSNTRNYIKVVDRVMYLDAPITNLLAAAMKLKEK